MSHHVLQQGKIFSLVETVGHVMIHECPSLTFFGSNRGQDRGGVVEREDPFMQLLQANKARMNGKDMMGVQLQLPGAFCLDLADALRFVRPKWNKTLLTPGDIATSISLYKGSYIGSFILTQFIWTSGISLRSRFLRYDQSFCPDQKSVLRTEKLERHEKAQKTVSVRLTREFLLTWLWHPAFIWWNGPLLMHLWPGMPGMGGNTPIGMAMGGHMTEQMEDQIRNMMQQVLMPFQDQVMSKLCSVEENLHRQLDGVLATHDAIYIYIHAVFGLYIHMGICDWISCISARVFMRYIASENVNPRLMSTPGCPIQVSRYSPTSDQLLTDCIGFAALWGSQEAIAQRMDFSQVAILQTVNACQVLLHKLDSSQDVCQMENTGEMVWQVLFREMFL